MVMTPRNLRSVSLLAAATLWVGCHGAAPVGTGAAAGRGGGAGAAGGTGGGAGAAGGTSGGAGAAGGGAAGAAAGGRGGTAGASGGAGPGAAGGDGGATGSSGAAGGGGSAAQDFVAACPASPPTGSCTVAGLVCPYQTQGCLCTSGSWTCTACPTARPVTGSSCVIDDPRMWLSCPYGNVTCLCKAGPAQTWNCGACPTTEPVTGSTCGNTSFECRYGNDTCACRGNWACGVPDCSPSKISVATCATGRYTCLYPDGESCSCGTLVPGAVCSCPAVAPIDGSRCVWNSLSSTPGACNYGNVSCLCDSRQTWHCNVPPCPTSLPTPGSSCSGQLSCTYGNSICACDGTGWSCS